MKKHPIHHGEIGRSKGKWLFSIKPRVVSPRNVHPQGSEDEPQSCLAAPDRLCVLSPFYTNDVCRSILATPWCFGLPLPKTLDFWRNFQANFQFFNMYCSSRVGAPGTTSLRNPPTWIPISKSTVANPCSNCDGGRVSGCRDVIEMSPNSRVAWRFLRHLETLRNIPSTLYTMFHNMLMYEFGLCIYTLYHGHSAICFVYLIHLKILDMFSISIGTFNRP